MYLLRSLLVFLICCCYQVSANHPPPVISQPRVDFVCGRQPPVELPEDVFTAASDVNAWPWMALLGRRQQDGSVQWLCDGSLINEQWIITTAYCLYSRVPSVVRLGEHDYRDDNDGADHKDYSVLRAVIYPEYDITLAYHDLGLLQLTRSVRFTFAKRPVCLPWGKLSVADLVGSSLILTGWDATQFVGEWSSVLQEVYGLTVFNTRVCDNNYKRLPQYSRKWPQNITDGTFLCVGHPDGGKDACEVGLGAPLVYRAEYGGYVLAGIVSTAYGCGLKEFPALYTPMHNFEYLTWIQKIAFHSRQVSVDFECGHRTRYFSAVGGITPLTNAWPWTALLGWRQQDWSVQWKCGGSLINEQWIITAAHCLDSGSPSVVRLGEHDYRDDNDGTLHEDYSVFRDVIYPEYDITLAYHDLALLQLTRRVRFTRENQPVCLPWGKLSVVDLVGRSVILVGWGATQFGGELSWVLQEVYDLTVFNTSVCDNSYKWLPQYSRKYPRGITDGTFLCVGHPDGGKDACKGDSGAPLVYQAEYGGYVLAGIVSKGYGCGLKEFPGLYTPTHNFEYLTWIKKIAF